MKLKLPKKDKRSFIKILQKRELEDLEVVNKIESYLQKRRGWVCRLPKKGSSVILLLSGGIDSLVAWELLTKKFGLKVYPFFVDAGSKGSRISVNFFTKYFKKKYPVLFEQPFIIKHKFLNYKFESLFNLKQLPGNKILDVIASQKYHQTEVPFFSGLSMLSAYHAVNYLEYLEFKKNIKVNTIICGVTAQDGISVRTQTLTFMRSLMLNIILFLNNFDLQFFSLFFEKEFDFFVQKEEIIKLGANLKLPLNKSYSCYFKNRYHCGDCLGCITRQLRFNQAKLVDSTAYVDKAKSKLLYLWMRVINYLKV